MSLLQISADEVKRRKVVPTGWYHLKIEKVSFEKSKDQQSYNHVFDFKGLEGEAKDIPFRFWVSEKAPAMGLPLVCAFLKKTPKDFEETGVPGFDPQNMAGAVVYAYNDPAEYNGQKSNNLKDFAPAKPEFSGEEAAKF